MNKHISYRKKKKKKRKEKIMIRKYENKEKHFKVIIIRIMINKSNLEWGLTKVTYPNSTKIIYKVRNPHQILQMVNDGD